MPTSQDRGNVGRGQSNESMRLESGASCRLLVGWFSGEVGAWVRYSDPLPAEECGNPNNWARCGSRRHKRIVSSQTFHSRLPAFDDMAIMDLSTGLIRQVDRRLLSSTFCWQAPRLVTRCGTGDIASQPIGLASFQVRRSAQPDSPQSGGSRLFDVHMFLRHGPFDTELLRSFPALSPVFTPTSNLEGRCRRNSWKVRLQRAHFPGSINPPSRLGFENSFSSTP